MLQDGSEVFLSIEKNTKLKKLMDVYCYRMCLDINGVDFQYNGSFIQPEKTPIEVHVLLSTFLLVMF